MLFGLGCLMICYLPSVLWINGRSSLILLSVMFSPWLFSEEIMEPWLAFDKLFTWLTGQIGPEIAPRCKLNALPMAVKFFVGIPFMLSSSSPDSLS